LKKNLRILIFTFCLFANATLAIATSSNKIDSLKALIAKDKMDTLRVIHVNELCREYIFVFKQLADIDSLCEQNILLAQKINDQKGLARIFGIIGNLFYLKENFAKANDYYFKALTVSEKMDDGNFTIKLYNSIGSVFWRIGAYSKALEYHKIGFQICNQHRYDFDITALYLALGNDYYSLGDFSNAKKYYEEGLSEIKKGGNSLLKTNFLSNLSSIYIAERKYDLAVSLIKTANKLFDSLGDYIAKTANLINLGVIHEELDDMNSAEIDLKEALKTNELVGSIVQEQFIREQLYRLYKRKKDYKTALEQFEKSKALLDTIYYRERNKESEMTEQKHLFEKKEDKIKSEREQEQAFAKAEQQKQFVIIVVVVIGLLLTAILLFFIYRRWLVTQKQKQIIESQKQLVDSAFKHIEEKNKEITDSINYAKRIQSAMITSDAYINEHLPAEHFILFKPKDIVSGDFYWALSASSILNASQLEHSKNNLFYLITADCTGHGVPGAFMSMLNISFLNEIIIERGIRLPNEVLNTQRNEIIKALNPSGAVEKARDGMDCVLCAYDFDKMLLHFAAANNPLWLIRNGELAEYKADKMPVGMYHEELKPFALNTIELQKGDIVYTSSDGYGDQFGENGKKLMKKRFKEELLKIAPLPMEEQKDYLNNFVESWKGMSWIFLFD
jgi:serine phosphatase RsbU (regulator of sigma subunit)